MTIPGDLYNRLTHFQGFSPEQSDLLRPLFVPCDYYAGSVIFEQDDPAEYLYLLVEGEVIIRFKPDDGPPLVVARVRPEGVVGWSAALGSPAYTSTAVCSTNCQLLRLSGSDLRILCEQYPEVGTLLLERLAAVISERLRTSQHQVIALLEQGLQASPNHL